MTSVADLGVNQENIRSYVLRNDKQALTQEQIDGTLYDYLEKVIRNPDYIPRWPKELKDEMSSRGILQNKKTGYPEANECMVQAWSLRAGVAEESLLQARSCIERYEKLLIKLDMEHEIFN